MSTRRVGQEYLHTLYNTQCVFSKHSKNAEKHFPNSLIFALFLTNTKQFYPTWKAKNYFTVYNPFAVF